MKKFIGLTLGLMLTGSVSAGSVILAGPLSSDGLWEGGTDNLGTTTKFRITEPTYLTIELFGDVNSGLGSVYPPLDWWLKTDTSSPEIVASGDKNSWDISTHIEGIIEGYDNDGPVSSASRQPFSTANQGSLYVNGDYYPIKYLESDGVTIPASGDDWDWLMVELTQARTSSVLHQILLATGDYKLIVSEPTSSGKYDNFYDGINLATQSSINPVPLPPALWLFGSALIGILGFRKKRSFVQNG